jgi:hypothetical protein
MRRRLLTGLAIVAALGLAWLAVALLGGGLEEGVARLESDVLWRRSLD